MRATCLRARWEHWSLLAKSRAQSGYSDGEPDDILGDSVRSIIDAGLADLVETDHRITDDVWLEPTPGHTPGHVSVRIQSGKTAGGDHRRSDASHDPMQRARSHRQLRHRSGARALNATQLSRVLRKRSHVGSRHTLAHPTAGRVVPAGEVWRFEILSELGRCLKQTGCSKFERQVSGSGVVLFGVRLGSPRASRHAEINERKRPQNSAGSLCVKARSAEDAGSVPR